MTTGPGARFVIIGPVKLFFFSIPDRSFKSFENYPVKLLVKETKCTSLEDRTRSTFLDNLISNYDFGPVKLPGLTVEPPFATTFPKYKKFSS